MRSQRSSWTRLLTRLGFVRKKRRSLKRIGYRRNLRVEQCEDRRMLATFMVTNNSDAPENTPAAVGTLRQAVFDANQSPNLDTIQFTSNLNGATIHLTEGQIFIYDGVTINATMLPAGLAIDADNNGFRIFNVTTSVVGDGGTTEINGLTLRGGNPEMGSGGAIFAETDLTVKNSVISGNTSGFNGGFAHFAVVV